MALARARATGSWPTRSAKVWGRERRRGASAIQVGVSAPGSARGLRLDLVGRRLVDDHRLLGAAGPIAVLVIDDRGLHVYLTRHVQPLHHLSEHRVVAVQERGLLQGNV